MTTTHADRHLALAGTRNVRDVGGYPAARGRRIRWRTLLRSDELTRLPDETRVALEELGVRQVIDLRWPEELVISPNTFRSSERVRYTSIPLLADDPTPHAGLEGMYKHVLDARGTQLADVVRALLADDGLPAIVGCAAGKDRTGVTIALLLDLAGVPRAIIVEDYAISAHYFASPVAHIELDDWRSGSLVVDSPPEFIEGALAHLDERHGGARRLLGRHGVTDAEMDRLVELLTEPAGA
jgi:protein-tyrosine phosphatase